MSIQEAIQTLVERHDLTRQQARDVMDVVMSGQATDAQIGAFLIALRCKGETADEVAGCAQAMRDKAVRVTTRRAPVIDTCGTGGDGARTFNISTAVAFVAAGAGACVAKHGNRAVSSACGSADVLEALGVRIDAPPERVSLCLDEAGIGFLFAPLMHGAMKHAIGPRRQIGTRTVFNVLGPLTNPAQADRQLLGVYALELTTRLAGVLGQLGSQRALVVHGHDGLDEITLTGPTQVSELCAGEVRTYEIAPEEFGMACVPGAALQGGTAAQNAAILRGVLDGEPGPARDVVLLNAAAALVVAGLASDLAGGLEQARESLDSRRARRALEALVRVSNG